MKAEDTSQFDQHASPKPAAKRKLATIAVATFAVGVALPILGFTLAIVHSLVERDQAFGVLGTICLIATIPMIMLGSHLMDRFDRVK